MNNLQKEVADYLSTNYNYNPQKDIQAAQEAAKMDRMSNEYFAYKPMLCMKECIIENMNYTMLKPVFDVGGDKYFLMDLIYQYDVLDFYYQREYKRGIVSMMKSITPEQAKELTKSGLNMGDLITYALFGLRVFPCVFDVLDFDWVDGQYDREPVTSRLKDPLYSFPEMDLALHLKDVFGFTTSQIIEVIDEEAHDYATYSVGDYNSDLRDEQMLYFNDFLKPHLLKDGKDQDLDSKIKLLKGYVEELDDIERELLILDLASTNGKIKSSVKHIISSKRNAQLKRLGGIPSRYLNHREHQIAGIEYPKSRKLLVDRIEKLIKEGK